VAIEEEPLTGPSTGRVKKALVFSVAFCVVGSVFYGQRAIGAGKSGGTKAVAKRDALNQPWNWASIWNLPVGNQAKLDAKPALVAPAKVGQERTVRIDSTKGDGVVPILQVPTSVSGEACVQQKAPKIVGVSVPASTLPFIAQRPTTRTVVAMPSSRLFEFEWLVVCPDRSVRTSDRFTRQHLENDFGQIGVGLSGLSSIGGHLVPSDFRGSKINHALAIYVDPQSVLAPRKFEGAVWPARETGDKPTTVQAQNISIGSMLVLPSDFKISALRSAPARAVASALRDFGGYVAGKSSNRSVAFGTIDDPSGGTDAEMKRLFQVSLTEATGCQGSDCPWQKDLTQIVAGLRLVTNSEPSTPGGPGGRRAACATAFRSGTGSAPSTCTATGLRRSTTPIKLLAFGDSLTEGGGSGGHSSYRGPLQALLLGDGQSVDFVGSMVDSTVTDPEHEGHGGYTVGPDENRFCSRPTATQLNCNPLPFNISSLVPSGLATYSPSVVVLWIGVNDTFTGEVPVGGQGISRSQIAADAPAKIGKIIEQVKAARPTADIIVATLSPLKGGDSADGDTISSGIRAVVAASSSSGPGQVRLVELADLGLADDDYFDFIHLSSSGAQKVAERFFLVLQSILQLRAD
jgi:lysophospholipase L1-like esterase